MIFSGSSPSSLDVHRSSRIFYGVEYNVKEVKKAMAEDATNRILADRVAVVAGATRGAGRGIAVELGAAGATVYCTGRSVRGATTGRPETIEETAELVTRAGGVGHFAQVDHGDPEQVRAFLDRVADEHNGKVDVLVNDVWGGDELTQWNVPFWNHSLDAGLKMLRQAVLTHIITSHYAAPLLIASGRGVLFEITDGNTYNYRGTFYYDLVKTAVMRMASTMSKDFAEQKVAALAVTPGFLRSEAVLDYFGVTESTWREGVKKDKYFAFSETPRYIGRAVVALAADSAILEKTGKTVATWDLAEEYGFRDVDGSRPNWKRNYEAQVAEDRK